MTGAPRLTAFGAWQLWTRPLAARSPPLYASVASQTSSSGLHPFWRASGCSLSPYCDNVHQKLFMHCLGCPVVERSNQVRCRNTCAQNPRTTQVPYDKACMCISQCSLAKLIFPCSSAAKRLDVGEAPPRVGEAVARQRLGVEDACEDIDSQQDQGRADNIASPVDSRMQG